MKIKYFLTRKACVIYCAIFLLSCSNNIDTEIVIPFSLENNRIVLDAVINGQKGRFLFDSGIMHSTIGVGARGLFPIAYTRRIYNEKLRIVLVYSLNKIQFGDVPVKARSWLINRNDIITHLKEEEGYDGLLGIRSFEGYWCELSFSKNAIILHKQKPEHYTEYVPLKTLSKYDPLYLPVIIDGNEFLMNIDTGMRVAFKFPRDVIEYKNPDEMSEIVSNGEVQHYYLVKTNSLSILDETYNDVLIMNNSYSGYRPSSLYRHDKGLIGLGFMKHYDFLFDYRELRKGKTTGMYYKSITPSPERNYGFFSFMKEAPDPGIFDFSFSEEGLEILDILKDSIAYTEYGLRPGTVITKINDEPVINFSKEELVDPSFFHRVTDFSILNEKGDEETIFVQNK
jgi:hypothetical protein